MVIATDCVGSPANQLLRNDSLLAYTVLFHPDLYSNNKFGLFVCLYTKQALIFSMLSAMDCRRMELNDDRLSCESVSSLAHVPSMKPTCFPFSPVFSTHFRSRNWILVGLNETMNDLDWKVSSRDHGIAGTYCVSGLMQWALNSGEWHSNNKLGHQ
ncbi:hypothetical protein KIL84_011970 [Mauremys mutica]|uniref:Uncharacterized protein n=1 Tax=Mauremys mutica TaxID=74926 RepID=A0A9D3XF82_9SAUR|nr:hypothetical protein KIL84_011970 [Mauremys mutica]